MELTQKLNKEIIKIIFTNFKANKKKEKEGIINFF